MSKGFTSAYKSSSSSVVSDELSGLKIDVVKESKKSNESLNKEVKLTAEKITNFINNNSTECPKILDIGCCTGKELRCIDSILNKPAKYYGMDIMKAVLDSAKELGPQDCNYIEGDVHSIPFNDNNFDVVFCKRLLIHSTDVEKAINEIVRVIKPNGLILFAEGDMTAFHLHTTDSRLTLVEKHKMNVTIRSIANPNIIPTIRSIIETNHNITNILFKGECSLIFDTNMLISHSSPIIDKLVSDNIISDDDAEYYKNGLKNPETVGYPFYSGIMFFISYNVIKE